MLNPEFVIDGLRWVLNPLEIVSVPVVALGEKVGSLGGESDSLLMSLDEWFSRAWNLSHHLPQRRVGSILDANAQVGWAGNSCSGTG